MYHNTSVHGVTGCVSDGYGGMVEFDNSGDGLGRYNIMNYRRNRSTGRYEYVIVGQWAGVLTIDDPQHQVHPIMWAGGTYDIPVSQCSRPCGKRQVKVGTHLFNATLLC